MDAHWGSAQFLELLNPEGAGLLERDGEFFISREFLNDFKWKGYNQWRGPQKGEAKGDREKGGHKGKGVEAGVDKMAEWQWSWKGRL